MDQLFRQKGVGGYETTFPHNSPDPSFVLDDHSLQLPDLRVELLHLFLLRRRQLRHLLRHFLHHGGLQEVL